MAVQPPAPIPTRPEPPPPPPRPTEEEFKTWIGARHILPHLKTLGDHAALESLTKRLKVGKVRAVAGSAVGASGNHLTMVEVDKSWWDNAEGTESVHSHAWRTGEVTISLRRNGSRYSTIQLFDVRFQRADIDAMIQAAPLAPTVVAPTGPTHPGGDPPPLTYTDLWPGDDPTIMRALERRIAELEAEAATKTTSSPNPPHAGGRPPKPFWDDMWADMVRQMYTGDLKYSRLSEIETAMHEWLVANDHEAGETVIRERARKLFAALQKEVGN